MRNLAPSENYQLYGIWWKSDITWYVDEKVQIASNLFCLLWKVHLNDVITVLCSSCQGQRRRYGWSGEHRTSF